MNRQEWDDDLSKRAAEILGETAIKQMGHALAFDRFRVYNRKGVAYFKPYRNSYYPGGTDCEIWEKLTAKGFAEKHTQRNQYWVSRAGLAALSAVHKVYFYSDAASGNEVDAAPEVIDVLLAHAVFCGYGCWIPPSAEDIARGARLPLKQTRETLKYLQERGDVKHFYEGGADDEGFVHCTHGWGLTEKWIVEHRERYEKAKQEEYKRIDDMNRQGDEA